MLRCCPVRLVCTQGHSVARRKLYTQATAVFRRRRRRSDARGRLYDVSGLVRSSTGRDRTGRLFFARSRTRLSIVDRYSAHVANAHVFNSSRRDGVRSRRAAPAHPPRFAVRNAVSIDRRRSSRMIFSACDTLLLLLQSIGKFVVERDRRNHLRDAKRRGRNSRMRTTVMFFSVECFPLYMTRRCQKESVRRAYMKSTLIDR